MAESQEDREGRSVVGTVVKVVLFGVFVYLMWGFFAVIEWTAVFDGIANLSTLAWFGLILVTALLVLSEATILASVTPHLGVVRGIKAFLAPTAAASVIPGPADLVARFAMYNSWDYSNEDTGVSVMASFFFTTGAKMSLPIFGALGLMIFGRLGTEVPNLQVAALIAAALLIGAIIVLTIVLRSAELARAIGARAGRVAHRLAKPFRIKLERDLVDELAEVLATFQATAGLLIKEKWPKATAAALFAQAMQFTLLLVSLRGVGITSDHLNEAEIFAAFALVQIITAIPISPGGLGIVEAAYITLLVVESDPSMVELVTAGTLVYRLFSWILIIPLGGIAWLSWRRDLPTPEAADVAS